MEQMPHIISTGSYAHLVLVRKQHKQYLLGLPGVVAVGIGKGSAKRNEWGHYNLYALHVYIASPEYAAGIPTEIEHAEVVAEVVGEIIPLDAS